MIEINLSKIERGVRTGRVKVTRGGKTFYREQRVGRKEGKIASLPQNIKTEILELRGLGDSGAKIKDTIQTSIDLIEDKAKLYQSGLIDEAGKIKITGQAFTDWAQKQGVGPAKKRRTAAVEEKEKHETTKHHLEEADNKNAKLEVELQGLKDKSEAEKKAVTQAQESRDRMRQQLLQCKAELGTR